MKVANLTKEKFHIPLYIVSKNLSVINFDSNYLRTGQTEWAKKKFWTSVAKTHVSNFFFQKVVGRGQGPKQLHFDQIFKSFGMGSS